MSIHRCIYYEESASTQPRTSPRKNLGELPIHRFRNTNIIYEGFFSQGGLCGISAKVHARRGRTIWEGGARSVRSSVSGVSARSAGRSPCAVRSNRGRGRSRLARCPPNFGRSVLASIKAECCRQNSHSLIVQYSSRFIDSTRLDQIHTLFQRSNIVFFLPTTSSHHFSDFR